MWGVKNWEAKNTSVTKRERYIDMCDVQVWEAKSRKQRCYGQNMGGKTAGGKNAEGIKSRRQNARGKCTRSKYAEAINARSNKTEK